METKLSQDQKKVLLAIAGRGRIHNNTLTWRAIEYVEKGLRGRGAYTPAQRAAHSRTKRRLIERGLIVCNDREYQLTDKGKETVNVLCTMGAETLTVSDESAKQLAELESVIANRK